MILNWGVLRKYLKGWIFRCSGWKRITIIRMWNSSASGWRHFQKFWIRENTERGLLQFEGKKSRYGNRVCRVHVFIGICLFAKDFVLYDFHMNVTDYSYSAMEGEKPQSADTSVWFAYGSSGRLLQYGLDEGTELDSLTVYALTQTGEVAVVRGNETPIQQNSLGHFIAALPAKNQDIDGDGTLEKVHDYARADLGLNAFNPAPQRFLTQEIPFELVFAERKYIMVYYENEILTDAEILVTSYDGERKAYRTDEHGWIEGLANRDIREGLPPPILRTGILCTVCTMHWKITHIFRRIFLRHIYRCWLFLL